jgi:hypothetical protein
LARWLETQQELYRQPAARHQLNDTRDPPVEWTQGANIRLRSPRPRPIMSRTTRR